MDDNLSDEKIIAHQELIAKGELCLDNGDYQNAFRIFGQALKNAEDNGDKYGISDSFSHLGHVYFQQYQLSFAEDCYQRAFDIGFELNEYELMAANANNLINIFILKRDSLKIESMIPKTIELFRKRGDKIRIAKLLSNYSAFLADEDKINDAIEILKQGIEELEGTDIEEIHGNIHDNLGQMYYNIGDSKNALFHYEKALSYFKVLKLMEHAGDTAYNIAVLYHKNRNIEKTREFLKKSLEFYSKHKNPRNKTHVEELLKKLS